MPTIAAHGLTAELPSGWDGEIYKRPPEGFFPSLMPGGAGVVHPVLHMANFALPPGRGDFGGGAVEQMGGGAIFISLFEHERSAASSALFAGGRLPWPVRPDEFDPNRMQRPLAGQSGGQWFFSVNGRAFCLYVVLGSHGRRSVLVREVNRLLTTIVID
jgi:hypothetical protein